MKETAIQFGAAARLSGILCEPESTRAPDRPVVVFLNAGLIHRIGPHRLHVEAARALAAHGLASLRFDLSGAGDSGHRGDRLPFEESSILETREAMDFLGERLAARNVILFGLCSGAMVAVKTAARDPRVVGAVLINTQSHTSDPKLQRLVAQKKESHYFWSVSIFNPGAWRRALTGRSAYRQNLRMLLRQVGDAVLRRRPRVPAGSWDMESDFRVLAEREIPVLHFFSRGDPAYEIYSAAVGLGVAGRNPCPSVTIELCTGTDHTFTPAWSRAQLIARLLAWVDLARRKGRSDGSGAATGKGTRGT